MKTIEEVLPTEDPAGELADARLDDRTLTADLEVARLRSELKSGRDCALFMFMGGILTYVQTLWWGATAGALSFLIILALGVLMIWSPRTKRQLSDIVKKRDEFRSKKILNDRQETLEHGL